MAELQRPAHAERAEARGTRSPEESPEDSSDEGIADTASIDTRTTASLSSSIQEVSIEHGRKYHSYKDHSFYWRPNDNDELDRLDLIHMLVQLINDGQIHQAPIAKNPQRILDIGCGRGIWCIDMGDMYPSATVIGVDISPSQVTFVPPNVKFEIDDVEQEWTFRTPFDYIHGQYLMGAIQDWPRLLKQCFEYTKPGGWVEFQDFYPEYHSEDGSLPPDAKLHQWLRLGEQALNAFGRDIFPSTKIPDYARQAGYTNVKVIKKVLPIGTWPEDAAQKEIGRLNWIQLYEGLHGMSMRLLSNGLGWKYEEIEVLLSQVRKELKDPNIHAQMSYYIVYAQKP